MGNITLTDIKKNNYSLIYNLLYEQEKLSKQEIANQLHLSLPTVTQNLVALEEAGLLKKGGQFESQVGRRAVAYTICLFYKSPLQIRKRPYSIPAYTMIYRKERIPLWEILH